MHPATKSTTAISLIKKSLAAAKKYASHNIFISLNEQSALKKAAKIDAKIATGQNAGPLAGIPYALKDNFLSPTGHTTAASKMLAPFHSPITATAVKKLDAAGAIMIGRTNLDAYAHGGSTENSYFGPTTNAYDPTRVAGGSSGGSAVAVALGIVPFALGTDTGGSIRQPAAFNGVYGIKPTFGTVSRYGVVAMASSTDTIGAFAKSAPALYQIMSIISGQDPNDPTTLADFITTPAPLPPTLKIGLIADSMTDQTNPEIRAATRQLVKQLTDTGHAVSEISMPILAHALAMYYIIVPAEIASNLSRYDAVRYGHRSQKAKTLTDLYGLSRDEGFMPENKRRILIGNFVLSSGFFDAYYLKAQKARTLLIAAYTAAFEKYDFLLTPTTPSPAFKLGAKTSDPIQMYSEDILTVPPSLAGLPALSIPAGRTKSGLPIGLQLIGPRRSDAKLLALAERIAHG
jgi:aspartyl-tRNA(Asn)/glutamyl-tRNA(Gln) amidotransferase subunit A